jgi:hypothetical protein
MNWCMGLTAMLCISPIKNLVTLTVIKNHKTQTIKNMITQMSGHPLMVITSTEVTERARMKRESPLDTTGNTVENEV